MADLTRKQAHSSVDKLGAQIRSRFPDADPARLEQLDSHLATVAMVIDHLYDEADHQ